MNKYLPTLLILCLISGCVNYRAVGGFSNGTKAMYGNVSGNLFDGTARIAMKEAGGNLSCSGNSKTTKINFRLDCKGQEGGGVLICSDSREMTANWVAETCTSGSGYGEDSYGNTFRFIYGMNDKEAAQELLKIASHRLNQSPDRIEKNISDFAKKIQASEQQQLSEDLATALAVGAVLFMAYDSAKNGYGFSGEGDLYSNSYNGRSLGSEPKSNSCLSDYECGGFGFKCVKNLGSHEGVCMKTVDQHGQQILKSPESGISIRPLASEQCKFDTECGIGFKCEPTYKVCVKE